ncbi:seipin isoform X3 [Anoplophora glabripennis]|uniref:seipin isoform X3 n=1 Tax=Anoplophora glabripennis TaxID=217634 RepID=UPI00087456B1|nr:seipin isoform X3 [Anoplophora glabripennis]
MFGIFSAIGSFIRLGPREYVRQKFKLPLVKFIHDTVNLYKSRTKAGVNNVREILFRGTVIALITALLVWLSIFMYIAFYYVYVPTISHERAVHLKFRPCGTGDSYKIIKGICSFPSAHVQLTNRQQLLMMGQPYKIHLDLDMPESPTNRELGMFMVCVDFRGITANLFFIALTCMISWYQIIHSEEYVNFIEKNNDKKTDSDSDTSSFSVDYDEASFLEEKIRHRTHSNGDREHVEEIKQH